VANEALNPYQQFFNYAGVEIQHGTLEFFENGQTVVQLSIYSDSDLTVAQSNPYTLDYYGRVRADVHYSGLATVVVKDAAGNELRQLDDVASSSDGNSGGITKQLDSVAAMIAEQALDVGDIVATQGYYAGTGYGGARYVIVAENTGTADDYLYIDLGNGLQAELLDREQNQNFLVAGAKGDGGSDDTDAMQAVIDQGGDIFVPEGFVFVGSEVIVGQNLRFVGQGTMKQDNGQANDFIQIIDREVTRVSFRDVTLDGNQANANEDNATVGWVLA